MDFDGIVEIIKGAKSLKLSILTQQNKADGGVKKEARNLEAKPEDEAIFKTLRGEEKVDYVVQKRFLQQKLEEKAKRGTDMRKKTKINKDLAEAPGGDGENGEKEEKKKSKKGISFGVTEVAEIGEDGKVIKMGEMETKKGKRKKKKKSRQTPDGTVATTDIDATTPKKKMTMAEYSKAMRKRTLEVSLVSIFLVLSFTEVTLGTPVSTSTDSNTFRNVKVWLKKRTQKRPNPPRAKSQNRQNQHRNHHLVVVVRVKKSGIGKRRRLRPNQNRNAISELMKIVLTKKRTKGITF